MQQFLALTTPSVYLSQVVGLYLEGTSQGTFSYWLGLYPAKLE